ncbi:transcription initiation factor TFIID subunit 1-like [Watersipora subatra]|uniref:transcription initiation factor TFIID subunit 1-like n=1 Tax=Watersipora subatra TaxID=2589382 RepID=UPI00355BFD2E
MSVSYNYDRQKMPHPDSSSSYDQGYNSQPQYYPPSVGSDGFSDLSFNPYSSNQTTPQYYGYTNSNVFSSDSSRHKFDVQRYPLNDNGVRARGSSADSDVYGHRPPSIISSVGRDADIESIASHRTQSTVTSYGVESNTSMYDQYRYNGELYRPVAAPRKVNSQVKRLFGEIHPRMLRPEEKPIVESGEETEDSMSVGSAIIPRVAPRASMRKSKSVAFIEDEAIRLENAHLHSILKSSSMPSRLDTYGKKLTVRFEHVDKYADSKPRRDITDYSDIDSDHGGKSKKNKNKHQDIWNHVAPVGPKPARNSWSSSQKSSTKGRRRSSSADRSRQPSRSGSRVRSSSASSVSKAAQRSPSASRKSSHNSTHQNSNGHTSSDEKHNDGENGNVTITMPENGKSKRAGSMINDIAHSGRNGQGICSDPQKVCKWVLIVGVPLVILIIVAIVVSTIVSQS